jgi:predicted nucleic acid-binding protein
VARRPGRDAGGRSGRRTLILADTSAWVEFLRDTGSSVCRRLDEALAEPSQVATTDAVLMEVLAGARDAENLSQLRRLLGSCDFIATEGPADYEGAADLYRACRERGETIRSLTDCLIATVAMRAGARLLHSDTDFEAIAKHAPLRLA